MVGGGGRREEAVVLSSSNVFSVLRKKKKSSSDKDRNGAASSKTKSKKKPGEKEVEEVREKEKDVFWAPSKLNVKSWADVDDDDDDDYFATTAPPQSAWAPAPSAEPGNNAVEESEMEGILQSDSEHRKEKIISADELSVPQSLFNEKIEFPMLEDLELKEINMEALWHTSLPAVASSIQNLRRLTVRGCHRLQYLFTSSSTRCIQQLEYLSVMECELMQEVIVKDGTSRDEGRFYEINVVELPKLEALELGVLPKLHQFCCGYFVKCPLLKTLNIWECPGLKGFISSSQSGNVTHNEEHDKIKLEDDRHADARPLFDEKFPSLKILKVDWNNDMEEIAHGRVAAQFCSNLKVLALMCFPNERVLFSTQFLQRFTNLQDLTIGDASFEEIVFHEFTNSREVHTRFLSRLKKLNS